MFRSLCEYIKDKKKFFTFCNFLSLLFAITPIFYFILHNNNNNNFVFYCLRVHLFGCLFASIRINSPPLYTFTNPIHTYFDIRIISYFFVEQSTSCLGGFFMRLVVCSLFCVGFFFFFFMLIFSSNFGFQ